MHRPRHLHTVVALKVSSLMLILAGCLAISGFAIALYAMSSVSRPLQLGSLVVIALLLVSLLAYRVFAASARCPLCMGPVLLSRQCSRNKKARTFLGSYRLRVAGDIVLLNRFCCPYCGEPTQCKSREAQPASLERHGRLKPLPESVEY